jgi:AcrR family transcriptional regulator
MSKTTRNDKATVTDRRILRTRRVLNEALAALLIEKDLDHISVRELIEKADVSRSTFYMHYTDIYDLYDHLENDFFSEIGRILVTSDSHNYHEIDAALLDYLADNAVVCRSFLRNDAGGFHNKLAAFIEDRYNEIVLYEMDSDKMREGWQYLSRYSVGGFVHMISMWLDSDMSFPRETLLKMLREIDTVIDPLYDRY